MSGAVPQPREKRGPQPQRVHWVRPEGEAPNSRVPWTAPQVQHTVYPQDVEFYMRMKQEGKRDEAKSREVGRDALEVLGYRRMAELLGCTSRTAINRRNRIAAHRLCTFAERIDEHGRILGVWMYDNPFLSILDDYRADPDIAKTPDTGHVIVRGRKFVSPAQAVLCQIAHVAVVPRRSVKPPVVSREPGTVDVSPISAVLTQFRVPDPDGSGALALLIEARVQCQDISPAELAEGLAADLAKRARWKAKNRETLDVNVPYIKTFIRGTAGAWAAGREDRRKEAAREAEAATRATRHQERQAIQLEYEEFQREAMDRFVASLPAAEYAALLADAVRDFVPLHPMMTKVQLADLARLEVRRCLQQRAPIPSFAEWRAERDGSDMRARAAG
jgi:hypothetical protein